MSKLDGNGRWQNKMLLTEHQEQYESRNKEVPKGRPTNDELILIRDFILLPHMLTIANKSIQEVIQSSNPLKIFIEKFLQMLIDRMNKDLYQLKRTLAQRNIKITEDEHVDMIIYYRYICRGYQEKFGFVRETMRSEISVRLTKYAAGILKPDSVS